MASLTHLKPMDRKSLSGPALKAFFKIADLWELSVAEQMTLLGNPSRSAFFNWRKNHSGHLPKDTLERISYLLGIYKALQVLLPSSQSADITEKGSAAVVKGSESRAHLKLTSAGSKATGGLQHQARSTPTSGAPAEKQKPGSSSVRLKQPTDEEEQPKPAPLTVETGRSRSVLSTSGRSASERPGSEAPPLTIISSKPKSKVIQWP